jgi:hypothetical protein
VCDLRAAGPHLPAVDEDQRAALAGALRDGRVPPATWRACVDALLSSERPDDSAALLDAIGHSYRDLVADPDIEHDTARQARLAAMQRLYLERDARLSPHAKVMDDLLDDLRAALREHRLGPVATRYGRDLLDAVALEHGVLDGAPVDAARLDALQAAGDEATLRACAARLPDPSLRSEAKRRVIRLHIAASPYPEVRRDARAVEEQVLRLGHNPVSPVAHPPLSASLDAERVPVRAVLVRQRPLVGDGAAQLLGSLPGDADGRSSLVAALPLRGALGVTLDGVSRPVTLCAPAAALDPAPCLEPAAVRLDSPLAYLDRDGASGAPGAPGQVTVTVAG